MKRCLALAFGLMFASASFANEIIMPIAIALQEGEMKYGECHSDKDKKPTELIKDLKIEMVEMGEQSIGNATVMMQTPAGEDMMFHIVEAVHKTNAQESARTIGIYHGTSIVNLNRVSAPNASSVLSNVFMIPLEDNKCYVLHFSLNSRELPRF